MTNLLGRLATRTLAQVPELRPVSPSRLARVPDGDMVDDEVLVETARGPGGDASERGDRRFEGGPAPSPAEEPPASREGAEPTPASLDREPPEVVDVHAAGEPVGTGELPPHPGSEPTDRDDEGRRSGGRSEESSDEVRLRVLRPARAPERQPRRTEIRHAAERPPRPERRTPRSPSAWEGPPLVDGPRRDEALSTQTFAAGPQAADRREPAEREETTVLVSIDRIEVRGPDEEPPRSAPMPWTEAPILNLDDYLRQRRGGRS